jgi:phospholipid/cholesterol/gamma-HCH transport system substrate-binding protein
VLWFAQVQLDRAFAYYDIRFESVSGLSNASDVRFSGLPVGQVVDVRLAPEGDGSIRVRIEVDAETPVREDSVATIEAQGVTGVSFVGISAGTPEAPILDARDTIPEIPAGRSVLQTLTQDAPQLITEVLDVARAMGEVLGEDNQARVEAILTNLEASSNSFASALDDFSALTDSISTAATDIAEFTQRLDGIATAANETLDQADAALAAFTHLAGRAEGTLDEGDAMLSSANAAFGAADGLLRDDLPALVADLRATNAALQAQIDALGGQAGDMLAEGEQQMANAGFQKIELTGAAADGYLATALDAAWTVMAEKAPDVADELRGFLVD